MPNTTSTARAQRPLGACGDRDPQPSRPVTDAFDVDIGKPDKQFTHARRIRFQQGLLDSDRRKTPSDSQSPCVAPGTYLNKPNSRPDPKRR
jgi:hypothetical protein